MANSFVKDVKECCAKLLKEPQADTAGMVSFDIFEIMIK